MSALDTKPARRWAFTWVNCDCPDARFIYNVSRCYGWGDNRSQKPVECDKDDAAEWKKYFKAMSAQRPLLGLALAIDFNQEPAQRAMEANKWQLVATGERGHDRIVAGTRVFARLYMKYFPKTGKLFPLSGRVPDTQQPHQTTGLSVSYSCSLGIMDYGIYAHKTTTEAIIGSSGFGDGKSLIVSRVLLSQLKKGFTLPKENFFKFAETSVANYYVSNPVKMFVGEGKKNG